MLNSPRSRLRRIQALQKLRAQALSRRPARAELREARNPQGDWSEFSRDCGAEQGFVVRFQTASGVPRAASVPTGLVLLGSGPKCTLQLPGAGVAERHAMALFLDGRFFLCDLGSPEGTWLGTKRIFNGWVPAGATIRIGETRILLDGPRVPEGSRAASPDLLHGERSETPSSESGLLDAASTELGELWLRLPDDDGPGHRLTKSITLFGRDARCRVRIPSRSVSRFHCVLVRAAGAVWVADLASREGIRVQGERVSLARIDDDCELAVGTTTLLLQRGAAIESGELVRFEADPTGPISEELVRELLSELRSQRALVAELTDLLREALHAPELVAPRRLPEERGG